MTGPRCGGVHQKKRTEPLPFIMIVDGEAAEKRDRDIGIGGKFAGHLFWQVCETNGEG